MSELTMKRYRELVALGRAPIDLPAEIYFNGDERLQKAHCETLSCPIGACRCGKGRHHLPEYQKTGTYDHPNLVAHRERVAADRLGRLVNGKMSDAEMRKIGNVDTLYALAEPEIHEVAQANVEAVQKAAIQKAAVAPKRPKIAAEPVNPLEPDVVKKAAAAATSVPAVDLKSDPEEDEKK